MPNLTFDQLSALGKLVPPGSASAIADAAQNVESLRTLGTGPQQAAAGNHVHAGAGGGITTLKKTADQIINGTAFQNITDLTFPVPINTDCAFKFYIVYRSAFTTTGFRFAINGPAGAVVSYFMTYQTVANSTTIGVATWLQGHWVVYDTMTATLATIAAGVDLVCMIEGRIKVGATSGTLAARAASELANNDLVIQKGSWGWWFA